MAESSKGVLAVLLIITMMISLVGTMTAVLVLMNHDGYVSVPVGESDSDKSTGRVSAYMPSQPVDATGRVAANLLSFGEGG